MVGGADLWGCNKNCSFVVGGLENNSQKVIRIFLWVHYKLN
jgi:hypothetical protein